jgi:hypothetical protein
MEAQVAETSAVGVVVPVIASVAGAVVAVVAAWVAVRGARQTEAMRLRFSMLSRRLEQFDDACARTLTLAQDPTVDNDRIEQAADLLISAAFLVGCMEPEDVNDMTRELSFQLDDWLEERGRAQEGAREAGELWHKASLWRRELSRLRRGIDGAVDSTIALRAG